MLIKGLIAVAALLFSLSAAAEPSRDQLISLYASAYGRLGIGIPDKPPHIYPVSKETLRELVRCQNSCQVQGAQVADSVFYWEGTDFSNPIESSWLLHEIVHYVQYWKKGPAKTCQEKADREWEAYKIQAYVLEQNDVSFPMPQRMVCDPIIKEL